MTSADSAPPDLAPRTDAWKWWVCGLLFLATVINYMDRQTMNQAAKQIKTELELNNEQYGTVESAFALAFALGAVLVGWTADRWNVRWIYPAALLGWSASGFATGFAQTFVQLYLCRFALGLFESGNWPCALRTTQRIFPPSRRTMANGLLQSGTAIGSILTPLLVQMLVVGPGTWNRPFFVVGAAGTLWVLVWLASVRREDLALPSIRTPDATEPGAVMEPSLWEIYCTRRFWVCVLLVIMVNLTWHFFRAWLPLFLQEGHTYTMSDNNYFSIAYYSATDLGALAAGFATLYLARRGVGVHEGRLVVFLICALLTSLSVVAAMLPQGPWLLGILLVIGFGALGLFPVYYSLSQELTVRHQGKITGTLGCITWLVSAGMHKLVGRWLDETRNYSLVVALAGLAPLLAFIGLAWFWGPDVQKDK